MKLKLCKIALRLIAFLGFGPLVLPWIKEEQERISIKQTIVLWGWLGLIFLAVTIVGLIYSYIVIYFPDIYQEYELEGWYISILRKILLCWLIFWFFGFIWGVTGSNQLLPLVSKFLLSKILFAIVFFLNSLVLILFLSGFALLSWSSILLKSSSESSPPVVYVLYDDLDYLPRWIFKIGFFPVIKASVDNYGRGSVALLVINKKSLSEALKHAHILFLATHGTEEGILSRDGLIKPEDVKNMQRNYNLRYVYLSGCKGGNQKALWEEAFNPAEVFAYTRMTATLEHIAWFWFSAPKLIRGDKLIFTGS